MTQIISDVPWQLPARTDQCHSTGQVVEFCSFSAVSGVVR